MKSLNESNVHKCRNVREKLELHLARDPRKVVILDDDPTGTQTVKDVPVLTTWDKDLLIEEFRNDRKAFFILTNTRAFSENEAKRINREIVEYLDDVSRMTSKDYVLISRGDSTLRGHFPHELEDLWTDGLHRFDGILFYPFFEEGKRYTSEDIHYVEEEGKWTPVSETAFAKDTTFGFKCSNLKDYIAEKTGGVTRIEEIQSISLEDIRIGGADAVASKLKSLKNNQYCVINSTEFSDAIIVALAVARCEAEGKRYMIRSAASFVKARLGIFENTLISGEDLKVNDQSKAGIIFIGSHVPKTTMQLNYLLENSELASIEVNVVALLDEKSREQTIDDYAKQIDAYLQDKKDVVVFTSRSVVAFDNLEENLKISVSISEGLIGIARRIQVAPRYVISKGGITSSDMATRGLNIQRAMVQGQIIPGVPVWLTEKDSKFPDLSFVVFPGNVGEKSSLCDAYEIISK
ncbi:hydroxyacid dehydrogenase [Alkalibacter rhizosphaerae]|uniref:Hydroxyacid dehydrogenase n=1 Tax=Alkalibacter rhizosphaerae TaxID=2815577 RepID=A0A975AGM4_9FIRM|nr:four-carbon acid sugar kinase family protein [Alkalibacter rhizosphaerae]QSX07699.1 hydroxyacid dehydrogenase [Alkalibacter rhizosphaerae]